MGFFKAPRRDPRLDQLNVSTEESNGKAVSVAKKADLELTTENLAKEWKTYLMGIPQETVRNLLLNTEVRLEEETLAATVTSALIENTLREERGLLEYLRENSATPVLPSRSRSLNRW
ncbi:MAG: hypothetical protein IPH16_03745 [Haliscomenobacter sp.]|nr:hypothetical protein [Haliscomenobacter sp.]